MVKVEVIGGTMFARGVRNLIAETTNWQLRRHEGRLPELFTEDTDQVTIDLFPYDELPRDNYTCIVVVDGEYFTPAVNYSFTKQNGDIAYTKFI